LWSSVSALGLLDKLNHPCQNPIPTKQITDTSSSFTNKRITVSLLLEKSVR
jgi:hypothetical protein